MCFAWGFQDGGMNCYISCVLGFQFDSKTTPFSVFKTVQSLSVFLTLLVEAHVVTEKAFTYYFGAVFVFQLSAFVLVLTSFDFRQKESSDELLTDVKASDFE
jgi:hypothetical protein